MYIFVDQFSRRFEFMVSTRRAAKYVSTMRGYADPGQWRDDFDDCGNWLGSSKWKNGKYLGYLRNDG